MKVSALTSNGDWRFGRGKSDYINRSEAVRQKVVTRLRSHQQDWWLDAAHGLPWFALLGERGTRDQLTAEIERVTLDTDGVQLVRSLSVEVSGREYSARVRYRDVYGEDGEVAI